MFDRFEIRITEMNDVGIYARFTFKYKGTKHHGRVELPLVNGEIAHSTFYISWSNSVAQAWSKFINKMSLEQKTEVYNKALDKYRIFLSEQTTRAMAAHFYNGATP